MANLTDIELRKRLEAYNVDVGPISGCTRYLWEKKLLKLEKSHKSLHLSSAVSDSESDHVPKSPSRRGRKKSRAPKCESFETPMDVTFNSSECLSSPDDYELIPDDEPGNTPFPGSVGLRSVRKKSLPKPPKNRLPLKRNKRCISSGTPEPSAVVRGRRKPGRPPKLRKLSGKTLESPKDSKKTSKIMLNYFIYVFKGAALMLLTAVLVILMAQNWLAQIENLRQAPLIAEPHLVSE